MAPLVELDLAIYHDAARAAALLGEDGSGGAWVAAGSGSLLLRGLAEAHAVHEPLAQYLGQRTTRIGPRLLVVLTRDSPLPERLQAQFPVQLQVPPLRERLGDTLLFVQLFAGDHPITAVAVQLLEHYTWPGNVAELRGAVQRAVQLAGSDPIDIAHLPAFMPSASEQAIHGPAYLPPEGVKLEEVEQMLIRQALERARGNKRRAAELLGLTRHTLLYRMEKYGISAPERS